MSELDDRIERMIENYLYPTLPYRSLEKKRSILKNTNPILCSECGGKCCKQCGCHFSPDDFKEISFEALKAEIEKGYISIDEVPGEMISQPLGVKILRIRNQGAPIVDTWPREKRSCILLTEKGCKLKYKERPAGGQLLIPSKKDGELRCQSAYDIDDCCYEWKPHQKVIAQLIEYFQDKEIPCSI